MDYGKIFTRAWEVFWKHKILWVFGILTGGLNGLASYWNYSRYDFSAENLSDFPYGGMPYSDRAMDILRWGMENTFLFVAGIILLVLVLLVVSYLILAFGYTGLIKGTLLVDEVAEKLTFGNLFESIKSSFWRVFGLNLLLGVGGMGLMMALFVIMMVLAVLTLGIGMLCFFPLLCVFVPLMWFLGIIVIQAMIAIVAEDLSIKDALVRAWKLVTTKIGPYLLIWLIVLIITFAAGLIFAIPQFISMVPMYAAMFSLAKTDDPSAFFQIFSSRITWLAIWTPIQMILMGLLNTYTTAVWVQTYLEARENGTLEEPDQPEQADLDDDQLEQTI